MNWAILGISFVILSLESCAANSLSERERATLASDTIDLTGTYAYEDGDRLFFECGGSLCDDILIRDNFLQENVLRLDRTSVRVIVRRVVACDMTVSTQVACIKSSNGSAFKIVKWISPSPQQGKKATSSQD